MFAEISFLKDFKFTFRAGIENDNTRQMVFQNGEYGQFTAQNGIATHYSTRNMTINLQELLTWERTLESIREMYCLDMKLIRISMIIYTDQKITLLCGGQLH